jgi:hypothetical protein
VLLLQQALVGSVHYIFDPGGMVSLGEPKQKAGEKKRRESIKMTRNSWMVLIVASVVVALFAPAVFAAVVVPNQSDVSITHENDVLDASARGYGNVYGDLIPERLSTSASAYWDDGRLRFNVYGNISGTFMPHDGTISPEMSAYDRLGEQSSRTSLSFEKYVFEQDGEWWQATFRRELSVTLNLSSNVGHYVWEDEQSGDLVDNWNGQGWASANVQNGLFTGSSSNFWKTEFNDRPSEWNAQFSFSGIAMPGEVTIIKTVPEPATLGLLVLGAPFLRRRRH